MVGRRREFIERKKAIRKIDLRWSESDGKDCKGKKCRLSDFYGRNYRPMLE
jgi:hypothetical protein